MLGTTLGKQLIQYASDYCIYDLETTGISCIYDEVIEISGIRVKDGRILGEFSQLVNPGCSIPYGATAVNNITNAMVADMPTFDKVLPAFLEFAEDAVLVGHNIASFDMKFLDRDCRKYFGKTLCNDYIDTLKLARICFPDWHHRRLSDLAEYYGISTQGAHRALADCRMNQQIYELLGKELNGIGTRGADSKLKLCPDCGNPMKKRSGRYGTFWGCTGYPGCRHTERI